MSPELSQLSQLSQGREAANGSGPSAAPTVAVADRARRGAEAYAAAPPDFDERAALAARPDLPAEWAEGFAQMQVMPRPTAYDLERWFCLIDDGGRFLDRWGAEAHRLGWTAAEVFGVGVLAPEARHDLKGLVPLLDGWEVVALTADKATTRNPKTGRTLSIYRTPAKPGQAALWEIR